MQAAQDSSVVKPRRRRLTTAHARRRARFYSNSVKRELLQGQSADELRSSHESGLGNGSAAFLRGLLGETDGLIRGVSERYETQREVSQKVKNLSLLVMWFGMVSSLTLLLYYTITCNPSQLSKLFHLDLDLMLSHSMEFYKLCDMHCKPVEFTCMKLTN